MSNELIVAAAGSGKTTHLIQEALKHKEGSTLITTYTEANESEIKEKIIKTAGCIPENIVVQTWFSFLLQHGVRPFQGVLFEEKIKGMILVNRRSGIRYTNTRGIPVYYKETDTRNHYFSRDLKIYSDKIAKFSIKCNEMSDGAVIHRLSRIYDRMYIDEVQDLASYDLDILRLLFKCDIDVIMVGDPRQVVYATHHARRLNKYSPGKIVEFVEEECKDANIVIDQESLNKSHRNNGAICRYAAKLYPQYPACEPCECEGCRSAAPNEGIFLVQAADIPTYLALHNPIQLRWSNATKGIVTDHRALNMGLSKGKTFDRVLIYPTKAFRTWIMDNGSDLAPETRAKFYVAITRARHSVGIVCEFEKKDEIDGVGKFFPE